MGRILIFGFLCERCGHEWVPRRRAGDDPESRGLAVIYGPQPPPPPSPSDPKICPRCKSYLWDKPPNGWEPKKSPKPKFWEYEKRLKRFGEEDEPGEGEAEAHDGYDGLDE
jgi:hypothetical protein